MVRQWRNDTHGQALLEFALVLPILLFLLFAILVVGWWMNAHQVLADAARAGARIGALTNDDGLIGGAITQAIAGLDPVPSGASQPPHTTWIIEPGAAASVNRDRGQPLTVTVIYTMPFTFAGLPSVFQSVRASTVAVMECTPTTAGTEVCDVAEL